MTTDTPAPLEDTSRLYEVPDGLRDAYIAALAEITADTDSHDALTHAHFRYWADRIGLTMSIHTDAIAEIGSEGHIASEKQRESYRRYLSDPSHYPGGLDELRADAFHYAAINRAAEATAEGVKAAQIALRRAEEADRDAGLVDRVTCAFCHRRRELSYSRTGLALDRYRLCEPCIAAATQTHQTWRRLPDDPDPLAW